MLSSLRVLRSSSSRRRLLDGKRCVLHLCHPLALSGMTACPLRQNDHEHNHKNRNDRRGNWTAQGESTMFYGLVEEIANGGAKRSGYDKRGPEQQDSRHIRPEINRSEHCQSGAEYERSPSVAEACIGDPIPKSCS